MTTGAGAVGSIGPYDNKGSGGGGGGSAAGPNGTVQASNGSGAFKVSNYLDHLTVAASVTVSLEDLAGFNDQYPGMRITGSDTADGVALVIAPQTTGQSVVSQYSYGTYSSSILTRINGSTQSPTGVLADEDAGEWGWNALSSVGTILRLGTIEVIARSDVVEGATTSEMQALNASNLGWQIKADGTFNVDTAITVAGVPIGSGGLPPGGSVGQPVVNTGSGTGDWGDSMQASPDTGAGGGTLLIKGGDDAGNGPGQGRVEGGYSNTTGVKGGPALLVGGDAEVGDADGGDVFIIAGNSSGTGRFGAIKLNNATSLPGAFIGTLTNAPATGNAQTWLEIQINGVVHYIPAWHA